jgi:protein TonB
MTAVLLHAGVVIAAIAGTTSRPTASPMIRDTVVLDLTTPSVPRPQGEVRPPPQSPGPLLPSAPGVPPIKLEPLRLELAQPKGSWRDLGLPIDRSWIRGAKASGPIALDTVLTVGDVDRPPEMAHEVRPLYPEALGGVGLSGAVELEYVIGISGRVDTASIMIRSSSHPLFTESAVAALGNARFRPALRHGRPVAVLVRQRIRFVHE